MTNGEKLDWLCRLRADMNNGVIFTPWNKEFTEALTGILEQEPCDSVNRATVLTLINDVKKADGFKDYSQYEYLFDQVENMSSIQPKTGHWIVYEDCEGKTRRCVCDRCGHETGDYTWKNPNFCEECGAKMVEPQGSEE